MSAQLLETPSFSPALRYFHEKQHASLAAHTEDLAGLRFSIILTAKWEASASIDQQRRIELRRELDGLRRHYSHKIDEIAMTFGVQNAIKAKEMVECSVAIPLGTKPLMTQNEDNQLYF